MRAEKPRRALAALREPPAQRVVGGVEPDRHIEYFADRSALHRIEWRHRDPLDLVEHAEFGQDRVLGFGRVARVGRLVQRRLDRQRALLEGGGRPADAVIALDDADLAPPLASSAAAVRPPRPEPMMTASKVFSLMTGPTRASPSTTAFRSERQSIRIPRPIVDRRQSIRKGSRSARSRVPPLALHQPRPDHCQRLPRGSKRKPFVAACLGHSDASAEEAQSIFDAGARARHAACRCRDGRLRIAGRRMTRVRRKLIAEDATLVGAAITIAPLAQALTLATPTPPRLLDLDNPIGRIAPGCRADLVHLTDDLDRRAPVERGRRGGVRGVASD